MASVVEIAPQTISRWVRQVIVSSLRDVSMDRDAMSLHQVRAHDLRALAASWASFNEVRLEEIMSACFWKNSNTFQDRYLKDMAVHADGIYSLGGLVVAHTVVNPPSQ